MKLIRSVFRCALLSGALLVAAQGMLSANGQSNPSSATLPALSPDQSPRDFRANLVALLAQDRFADLDAVADGLRTQQSRFKGGAWRLHAFYGTLSYPGSATAPDAEWRALIAKLQRWTENSPASPTPRVTLARTYLRFAWKARGTGFADTVTPEGWTLFRQRVQSARDVLEEAAKLTGTCPEWYRQMQTVALAQQWDRKQFDTLADQAMANEPSYFYFALAEANYLLPKWYGQQGDTERYAGQVADRTGGAEGAAVYFRIAAAVNCCGRTQAPAMSWPRVQEGFASIEQLYGSTNYQRNAMAYLALRAGDAATAKQLFARIGNDWDHDVWKTKARFDASRTGEAIANIEPVGATPVFPVFPTSEIDVE
ncbi:MAG: hypothetical protein WBF89_22325 [Steroidobacteraceae bacterium]